MVRWTLPAVLLMWVLGEYVIMTASRRERDATLKVEP